MQDIPDDSPQPAPPVAVRQKIGVLTRQLHDALDELGYAEKLRSSMGELPDAQSRLSYIARLTGEAAEKVLNRVDQAKTQNDYIAAEARRVGASLVKDPVATVARGEIMNFLSDVERVAREADTHLTEIMMAQDFHDLTGQVIARVVHLASTLEEQLLQLLIQTAPSPPAAAAAVESARARLHGPVVDPQNTPDVVTDQSQVDDLLASLGF
ncbi:protein phosphatase CheZ [Verminephrobacter aporrectodeae]|uniref:Protein phosphatase CheZ n=1 Tax=Verminephrobacter aporrectodeae subsp. tuberculatae TaxID=1110392 RepID=A0ABT3KWR5_9BURK|nr:protein phosphatase CheZ [Verminephrobacter aporrectodeae]MCW5221767.1 protein phosphatase CheZ [Verminephrobacter aporrectodeae subsp. tuberculatae]MCW5258077.1 protein phosphatase CheZ [Verminephrobacter aporrectodeae subsp. tuberculatae]MCW5291057.1 protein phosphatase CheZ [Verminephrobacter aporrectodeae subsp. tuberculatae]MCW5322782.1 protein phosphatase CheZ [Verminephrobacter aporrectodeae subsp. tuberculatae]MCW8166384.1 protein phosphatase CheZ [Verminephrobacter aporrectodeae su